MKATSEKLTEIKERYETGDGLNESWLHGKYDNGEINTYLPYVAVNDPDFYAQGEEADNIISSIYERWLKGDCTEQEAFTSWINQNLEQY